MARVTVENCVDKIPNRFDLVLLTSQRARALAAGAPLTVDRDNDKNPVVALREVADETITPEELHEAAIYNLRKHVEVDEPEEDDLTLLMAGQAHAGETSGSSPARGKPSVDVASSGGAETKAEAPAAPATDDATKDENLDGLSSNYFSAEDDIVEEGENVAASTGESASASAGESASASAGESASASAGESASAGAGESAGASASTGESEKPAATKDGD